MIISKASEISERCAALRKEEFITIDTEFLREKTYYPKLCLIQISDPKKNAFAIDPLDPNVDLTPVFELLKDEKVLKVFHAARQDMEIFYNLMQAVPTPVFDTQIAAMVCGYGDSVGYESLVKNICGHGLDKSAQFTNWAHRPLSTKQMNYALADVTHLCDIYDHLSKRLESMGRTRWVFEEEEILMDPATYENDPQEMWRKIKIRSPKPKTLAVLRELAAWREQVAQTKNLPRTWIMRDDTLADMASQAPTDMKELKKIRNIPGDIENKELGKTLLSTIQRALDSEPKSWPKMEKRKPLSPKASAALDVLKMLLKIQSAENGVATKLVATSNDLEELAMEDKPKNHVLKGWRYEVFGREAMALKNGELAIGLKDGKITKIDLTKK